MQRKILIAAYVLSILGLIAELSAFLPASKLSPEVFLYVKGLFSTLYLDYFRLSFLEYFVRDTGMRIGFLNVFAYTLLLLGAFTYHRSNGRETRFVRFFAAIYFIQGVLSVIWIIASPILYGAYVDTSNLIWWLTMIPGLLKAAAFIYLSHKVLKYFAEQKPLAHADAGAEPLQGVNYVRSSKWKRFANGSIDFFTALCIFSPSIALFKFLDLLAENFGEQFALSIFAAIARVIYYVLSEGLFDASPAKFLTETRVVTDTQQKVSMDTVLGRTFSRLIPFDGLSFFGDRGWHDSISKTHVVNEVRTGVNGARYLLIFPVLLFTSLAIWAGAEFYEDYKSRQSSIKAYNEKILALQNELDNLTTSHFIEIEPPGDRMSSERIILKVEVVDGEEITCSSFINQSAPYEESLIPIERLYLQHKRNGTAEMITIKLTDLHKAYTKDYDQQFASSSSAKLLGDNQEYVIRRINRLFAPSIVDRGTGGQGPNSITIDFENYGWSCELQKIENIEGEIVWNIELPKQIPNTSEFNVLDFSLFGTYTRGSKYKFKLTVSDSLNRPHYFLVEGVDMQKTVKRVD